MVIFISEKICLLTCHFIRETRLSIQENNSIFRHIRLFSGIASKTTCTFQQNLQKGDFFNVAGEKLLPRGTCRKIAH